MDARILPEAIVKAAEVCELLRRGKSGSVGEATKQVGISRSVYYRYRDYIHPFSDSARQRIVTLSMELEHEAGVLSGVLGVVAQHGGNVLTINQGIPTHGLALASVAVDTARMTGAFEAMLEDLRATVGVHRLEVIGQA